MPNTTLFFDTNCFSEIPKVELRPFIQSNIDKIVLDSVLTEIQEGYKINPEQCSFSYALDKDGKLKGTFKLLDLSPCNKKIKFESYNNRRLIFKEYPLLCTSYYTWFPYALRPSIITDPFRHIFNDELDFIQKYGDADGEIREALGKMRSLETRGIDIIREQHGKAEDLLTKSVLKSARKKKTSDYRKNTLKITDCQIVTSALIYACYFGANTFILCCDRDLCDVFENITRSIVEKYVINSMLEARIDSNNSESDIKQILYYDDMQSEVKLLFERIRKEEHYISFGIWYYQRSDNKVYPNKFNQKIPLWLRDFILEYKLNLNCFSIQRDLELKYRLNYVMDPDLEKIMDPNCINPKIRFNVSVRKKLFYGEFVEDCERICKYSKSEREDPYKISGFQEI